MILKTKPVETKFGKLYITSYWRDDHLEENSNVYILDEDSKEIDYYTSEFINEWCEAEHETPEEWIEGIAGKLADIDTVEELLEWLCVQYDYCGTSKEQAKLVLANGERDDATELTDNDLHLDDYVRHIGEYVIVIRDY